MFEREPTEGLNEDLSVPEVVGEVDSLKVSRTATLATSHSRPGNPAVVQPGTGAQTPGTHRTLPSSPSPSRANRKPFTPPPSLAQSLLGGTSVSQEFVVRQRWSGWRGCSKAI